MLKVNMSKLLRDKRTTPPELARLIETQTTFSTVYQSIRNATKTNKLNPAIFRAIEQKFGNLENYLLQ